MRSKKGPWTRVCVGDIVLVYIHFDVVRPLLVLGIKGRVVTGILTVDPNEDSANEWVQQRWFYKPTPETLTKLVRDLEYGFGVGQWVYRADYMEGGE